MTDSDPLLCMICGKPANDAIEYEEADGEMWVYCRACDCWTSHPSPLKGEPP